MKTLIICYSYYRMHTEKIAKVLADRIDADIINLNGSNDLDIDLDSYDLIGFGSGIYTETMSPKLFMFIDKLDLEDKNVFVFSTSGIGMKFYNNSLVRSLQAKGSKVKGSFACFGSFKTSDFSNFKMFDILSFFARNRPNKVDFRRAEKFIDRIIKDL